MSTQTAEPTRTVIGTVTIESAFERRENRSDYAAWYTQLLVEPQTCDLVLVERNDGKHPSIVAHATAAVVEDYYGAHFGGVPVSTYDRKQNAGKVDKCAVISVGYHDDPAHFLARLFDGEYEYVVGNHVEPGTMIVRDDSKAYDDPYANVRMFVELDDDAIADVGIDLAAARKACRELDNSAFGADRIERMQRELGSLMHRNYRDKIALDAFEAGDRDRAAAYYAGNLWGDDERALATLRSQFRHTFTGVAESVRTLDAEVDRQTRNRRNAV